MKSSVCPTAPQPDGVLLARPTGSRATLLFLPACLFSRLMCATLALCIGCGAKAPSYETTKLARRTLRHVVVASGEVNARTRVNVGSQVSGTVAQIFVDFGARVRRGERLLLLDSRLLRASAERAEALVAARRADVAGMALALKQSERAYGRQQKLAAGGVAAPAELESAEIARDTARTQVLSAQAQLAQACADAHQAETNLELSTIRSPIDGLVIDRQVQVGQTVAAQFQVQTLFTVASDMSQLQILTSIDEADIGSIAPGQKASMRVDAYPGRTFSGCVESVRQAPSVTAAAGGSPSATTVVTYLAVVAAQNNDGALRQGMTAQITIEVEKHENVVAAPLRALRFVPEGNRETTSEVDSDAEEDLSQGRLWTLTEEGPTAHPVKLGIRDNRFAEVVTGLSENASVLIGRAKRQGKSP